MKIEEHLRSAAEMTNWSWWRIP